MKTALWISVAMLLAGNTWLPAADTVELNGITSLGHEKLACFLLYQPALTAPRTFTLAVGESRYGFKLLAVDAARQQVLVEQCGLKKSVRINSTPELIATDNPRETGTGDPASGPPPAPEGNSAASYNSVATYLASDETARIRAGNPLLPAGLVPGAANNPNNGQGAAASPGSSPSSPNNTGASASNPGVSGGSQNTTAAATPGGQNPGAGTSGGSSNPSVPAGQNNYADQLWYQESLSLEQSRATSVDQVLNGSMTPFPRTPLTPASTPSQLVGQEVYFSGQIPGYKVTGYLNQ